jgi:hypothetical protein
MSIEFMKVLIFYLLIPRRFTILIRMSVAIISEKGAFKIMSSVRLLISRVVLSVQRLCETIIKILPWRNR